MTIFWTVYLEHDGKFQKLNGRRAMKFEECKKKYFIIVEGEERAIIRDTPEAAEKKRKALSKYSKGKKIFIFAANERNQ